MYYTKKGGKTITGQHDIHIGILSLILDNIKNNIDGKVTIVPYIDARLAAQYQLRHEWTKVQRPGYEIAEFSPRIDIIIVEGSLYFIAEIFIRFDQIVIKLWSNNYTYDPHGADTYSIYEADSIDKMSQHAIDIVQGVKRDYQIGKTS